MEDLQYCNNLITCYHRWPKIIADYNCFATSANAGMVLFISTKSKAIILILYYIKKNKDKVYEYLLANTVAFSFLNFPLTEHFRSKLLFLGLVYELLMF